MNEITYDDSRRNRGRYPLMFVVGGTGDPVRFDGHSIPGMVAITASQYTKMGKWSGTGYTLSVADGVAAVEVCQGWEGWGATWSDIIAASTNVLAGPQPDEAVMRAILRAASVDKRGLAAAIAAADENEAALALLAPPANDWVVVTRHPALVQYLTERGIVPEGTPVLGQATVADVAGKRVVGVLPLWLAAAANTVTTVDLDIPPEMRGVELTLAQIEEYARDITTYRVRKE